MFARDANRHIRDIALWASDRFAASVNDQFAQVFYYSRNIPRRGSGPGSSALLLINFYRARSRIHGYARFRSAAIEIPHYILSGAACARPAAAHNNKIARGIACLIDWQNASNHE